MPTNGTMIRLVNPSGTEHRGTPMMVEGFGSRLRFVAAGAATFGSMQQGSFM